MSDYRCAECNFPIFDRLGHEEPRVPCPKCGSTRRKFAPERGGGTLAGLIGVLFGLAMIVGLVDWMPFGLEKFVSPIVVGSLYALLGVAAIWGDGRRDVDTETGG